MGPRTDPAAVVDRWAVQWATMYYEYEPNENPTLTYIILNIGVIGICSRLRVHGLDGLRVADASVMPDLVAGNTNAACIMIGERAAEFIRADWRLRHMRG